MKDRFHDISQPQCVMTDRKVIRLPILTSNIMQVRNWNAFRFKVPTIINLVYSNILLRPFIREESSSR